MEQNKIEKIIESVNNKSQEQLNAEADVIKPTTTVEIGQNETITMPNQPQVQIQSVQEQWR